MWFVVKEVRAWEWVEHLDMYCWVSKSHERITPERNTEEEANEDFARLGFRLSSTACVQCNDEINIGEFWVRYIVQMGSKRRIK